MSTSPRSSLARNRRACRIVTALLAATLSLGVAAAAPSESSGAERAAATPEVRRPGLVDINTATEKELESIPGVGPSLAKKIVEYRRTAGSFKKVDELLNVKGIGEKSLEKLRPYVTAGATGASGSGGKS